MLSDFITDKEFTTTGIWVGPHCSLAALVKGWWGVDRARQEVQEDIAIDGGGGVQD